MTISNRWWRREKLSIVVGFWKVRELLQNATLEATCALVIVWIFCSSHRTPYGRYLKVVEHRKRRK